MSRAFLLWAVMSAASWAVSVDAQVQMGAAANWVVHDGALIQQGMPRFDDLSREQVLQISYYIRAGARSALGDHHE